MRSIQDTPRRLRTGPAGRPHHLVFCKYFVDTLYIQVSIFYILYDSLALRWQPSEIERDHMRYLDATSYISGPSTKQNCA